MAIVCDACENEPVPVDGVLCERCAQYKRRCRSCNRWDEGGPLCWSCRYDLEVAVYTASEITDDQAWDALLSNEQVDPGARSTVDGFRRLCLGFLAEGWRLESMGTTLGRGFRFVLDGEASAEVRVSSIAGPHAKVWVSDGETVVCMYQTSALTGDAFTEFAARVAPRSFVSALRSLSTVGVVS